MKKYLLLGALGLMGCFGFAQNMTGLVSKYTFNNGDANDEVGQNDGAVSGATLTADRFGNANSAYHFDGASFIDFGDSADFRMGTSDFSLSFWVNYAQAQQAFIISKRAGASGSYNMFYVGLISDPLFGGASLEVKSLLRPSNGGDRKPVAGNLSGAWHHIVLRHTTDSTSYFVDGQWVNSDTNSQFGGYDVAGFPLVAGYSSEQLSNYYTGDFDDFFVYRRALAPSEIDSLFNVPNHVPVSVDHVQHAAIDLYPNPSKGKVTFSATVAEVKVYSTTGQLVAHAKGVNGLDLNAQPAGIYFLDFMNAEGEKLQRSKFVRN